MPSPAPKPDAWSFYTTGNKSLPSQEVAGAYAAGKFIAIKQAVLNAGIPDQYYWVHFNLVNNTPERDLIIDIDNARLNQLELFESSGNSLKSLGRTGDFYPFSRRQIPHKNFIYQVAVEPGHHQGYFLFVNQVGHTFTLPVKVFTRAGFLSATYKDYLLDGVIYGTLFFVALLSLLFFLTSMHSLYLYYGLYILGAILWFFSYFGLGNQYLWSGYPALNTVMAPLIASLNMLLNLQICQVLLKLHIESRLMNRLANYTKYFLAAVALFPVVCNLNRYGYAMNHGYLLVFLFAILFAIVIVLFSVFFYAVKGLMAAKVYLIASVLKACGMINLALLELGIVPATLNMEGLLQTGIFIEITLLTYALVRRYTIFKVRTFDMVTEALEKERFLISSEIHDAISNTLTGISFGIANFARDTNHLSPEKKWQLKNIADELNKVQSDARNISHNTMPDYIKNSSIADIVEHYIEDVQSKTGKDQEGNELIRINFSANEQPVSFPEAIKLNIFRIIQEVITNILKHSGATNTDLVFSFGKRELLIIAEDNGIGLDRTKDGKSKGMGIKNMQSRVELLKGSISISSPVYKRAHIPENTPPAAYPAQQEYGTMIRIKIPYRDNLLSKRKENDF